jgi:hypothetical protein
MSHDREDRYKLSDNIDRRLLVDNLSVYLYLCRFRRRRALSVALHHHPLAQSAGSSSLPSPAGRPAGVIIYTNYYYHFSS